MQKAEVGGGEKRTYHNSTEIRRAGRQVVDARGVRCEQLGSRRAASYFCRCHQQGRGPMARTWTEDCVKPAVMQRLGSSGGERGEFSTRRTLFGDAGTPRVAPSCESAVCTAGRRR